MSVTREQRNRVEAVLMSMAGETVSLAAIERISGVSNVRDILIGLDEEYRGRSIMLVVTQDGCSIRTRPEHSDMSRALHEAPRRLSRAAFQVLAVVALYGPSTRSEIERHRGVGLSPGILETIVDMGLVVPGPRRETPGRPMTWLVTQAFRDMFNLTSGDILELSPRSARSSESETSSVERRLELDVPENGAGPALDLDEIGSPGDT